MLSGDTIRKARHTDTRTDGEIVMVLSAFKESDDARRSLAGGIGSEESSEFNQNFLHTSETAVALGGKIIEESYFPARKRAGVGGRRALFRTR